MQMESFLSSMVKKIRTESERSVSPMNRKINREFSQSVKQRVPPLRQTKTVYARSVVSNLEGMNVFSGEITPERRQLQQANVINMEISSQEEFFKPTMNRELVNLDFSEINIQPTQPKAKK